MAREHSQIPQKKRMNAIKKEWKNLKDPEKLIFKQRSQDDRQRDIRTRQCKGKRRMIKQASKSTQQTDKLEDGEEHSGSKEVIMM